MAVEYTEEQLNNFDIVLYKYQFSRNVSHPGKFLKDINGVCVTDGYQVCHTLEQERED